MEKPGVECSGNRSCRSYLRPSSWIKGIKFSLKGQNLLTLSGIKDVDPECIDAGVTSYPLLRSVTGGVKLNF